MNNKFNIFENKIEVLFDDYTCFTKDSKMIVELPFGYEITSKRIDKDPFMINENNSKISSKFALIRISAYKALAIPFGPWLDYCLFVDTIHNYDGHLQSVNKTENKINSYELIEDSLIKEPVPSKQVVKDKIKQEIENYKIKIEELEKALDEVVQI